MGGLVGGVGVGEHGVGFAGLVGGKGQGAAGGGVVAGGHRRAVGSAVVHTGGHVGGPALGDRERESGAEGKSVDLGGRRIIKKKTGRRSVVGDRPLPRGARDGG